MLTDALRSQLRRQGRSTAQCLPSVYSRPDMSRCVYLRPGRDPLYRPSPHAELLCDLVQPRPIGRSQSVTDAPSQLSVEEGTAAALARSFGPRNASVNTRPLSAPGLLTINGPFPHSNHAGTTFTRRHHRGGLWKLAIGLATRRNRSSAVSSNLLSFKTFCFVL